MAIWEYITAVRAHDQLLTDEQLSKFGARGYELVSVLALTDEVTVVGHLEKHTNVHYFFKRPKSGA